jgi:hypothetical protein
MATALDSLLPDSGSAVEALWATQAIYEEPVVDEADEQVAQLPLFR